MSPNENWRREGELSGASEYDGSNDTASVFPSHLKLKPVLAELLAAHRLSHHSEPAPALHACGLDPVRGPQSPAWGVDYARPESDGTYTPDREKGHLAIIVPVSDGTSIFDLTATS